jgi:hypothetical protein
MRRADTHQRRGPAFLLWALLTFVGLQAGLTAVADRLQPELRYPEMGYRLARLRARLAEDPQRPLLLALGSSRTELGVSPAKLMIERTPEGRVPLAFNFGLIQADPITQLVVFRTLLRDGIRPALLMLEIMPPFLSKTDEVLAKEWRSSIARYGWHDLGVLRRYCREPAWLCLHWCRAQWEATARNRSAILARYAPNWLPADAQPDQWKAPDPWGWLPPPNGVSPEQYRLGVLQTRAAYLPYLDGYQISPAPDHALRELLALCRRERVRPVLVVLPEATDFRSLYSPAAQARISRYLAHLSQEYGAPIVDARNWVPDHDFVDPHHLLVSGAITFTDRLNVEVVRPLLAGELKKPERAQVTTATQTSR